jgi:dGTPase
MAASIEPPDAARRVERRHRVDKQSSPSSSGDPRSEFERDRDRILYSSAFRRLSGITQVASPSELYPVHNRLTHSLKVAQVGRTLARQLLADPSSRLFVDAGGGLDPDVVEAASLAHDLGHPPFGHVAERELNALLLDGEESDRVDDGYDGNAQSFRIVTDLSVRYDDVPGLNLTRATLRAILKYPWFRGDEGLRRKKWGAYRSECEDFRWCRSPEFAESDRRSIEAELMDWADDITYAVHDVEDFFRAGLIPLDRLASDARERARFLRSALDRQSDHELAKRMERAFLKSPIIRFGLPGPFRGSRYDRSALHDLTSRLIGDYVTNSARLERAEDGFVRLAIRPDIEAAVRVLKELTWYYVIESPALVAQRFGQRALIRSLFGIFCNAANSSRDVTIFPLYFRERLERNQAGERGVKRTVADLISGMSEAQAAAVHQRLTGQSLGSALDTYLQ